MKEVTKECIDGEFDKGNYWDKTKDITIRPSDIEKFVVVFYNKGLHINPSDVPKLREEMYEKLLGHVDKKYFLSDLSLS